VIKINPWKKLSWNVKISWSKNATLPILWAALLLNGKVTLNNIPKIWDVLTFLDILEGIWAKYEFKWNTLFLDTTNIISDNLDLDKIRKIRASILLLSPILYFFENISIPIPGWCKIWKRPIDAHLKWLKNIGYNYIETEDNITLSWKLKSWNIILDWKFWVTSTENLIVANVLRKWNTTIKQAAIEPHIMNLIDFLRKAWANIQIRYNHDIIISWVDKLVDDFKFDIVSDYIESWTFMILWALASKDYITIENARIDDLFSFIEKLKESWVKIEDLWWDKLKIYKCDKLKATNIQTNIFPGFPTDLQSPFTVLQTQSKWISNIHEILFEWRLNFLVELETLWANINIVNSHEAIIIWKTPLIWWSVTSWDLRAWAAMVIAWIISSKETSITKVEYIYRWYENFVKKLQSLGADIKEI